MKVILQPEARTISDREIRENQEYLINLFAKINNLISKLFPRSISKPPKTAP